MLLNSTNQLYHPSVVDIGVNPTNNAFASNWRSEVQEAIDAGVEKMILTGVSIQSSKQSLDMAKTWYEETKCPNLYATVGVHPHHANEWDDGYIGEMEKMLQHPFAVAIGECGLDYNRNYSCPNDQRYAFREQLKLAMRMNKPMFIHERDAHGDLIDILDKELSNAKSKGQSVFLPQIVVHCFTGREEEALTYIERGFYIGFTGTICKHERGEHLRKLIPKLPLDKIMVETDAPFMGFKKGRRSSKSVDCVDVASKLSEIMQLPFPTVCDITTSNALQLFRIPI